MVFGIRILIHIFNGYGNGGMGGYGVAEIILAGNNNRYFTLTGGHGGNVAVGIYGSDIAVGANKGFGYNGEVGGYGNAAVAGVSDSDARAHNNAGVLVNGFHNKVFAAANIVALPSAVKGVGGSGNEGLGNALSFHGVFLRVDYGAVCHKGYGVGCHGVNSVYGDIAVGKGVGLPLGIITLFSRNARYNKLYEKMISLGGCSQGLCITTNWDEVIADQGTYNVIDNSWCFAAGTKITTDLQGNTKNIEDIKVGDTVVSYDILNDEFYLAKVNGTKVSDVPVAVYDVTLSDGSCVTLTKGHPILTTEGFKAVDSDNYPELKAGDTVKTMNGEFKVVSVKACKEPVTVYNIDVIDFDEVEDNNICDTFIANGFIVHNVPEPC